MCSIKQLVLAHLRRLSCSQEIKLFLTSLLLEETFRRRLRAVTDFMNLKSCELEVRSSMIQLSPLRSSQTPIHLFFFSNDELKTHKSVQITQYKLILTQQTDPPSQGRSRQLRQRRASQWATPPTNLQKTGRKTRRATETTVYATPMQQSGTWYVEHREGPFRSIFLPTSVTPQELNVLPIFLLPRS